MIIKKKLFIAVGISRLISWKKASGIAERKMLMIALILIPGDDGLFDCPRFPDYIIVTKLYNFRNTQVLSVFGGICECLYFNRIKNSFQESLLSGDHDGNNKKKQTGQSLD